MSQDIIAFPENCFRQGFPFQAAEACIIEIVVKQEAFFRARIFRLRLQQADLQIIQGHVTLALHNQTHVVIQTVRQGYTGCFYGLYTQGLKNRIGAIGGFLGAEGDSLGGRYHKLQIVRGSRGAVGAVTAVYQPRVHPGIVVGRTPQGSPVSGSRPDSRKPYVLRLNEFQSLIYGLAGEGKGIAAACVQRIVGLDYNALYRNPLVIRQ